MPAIERILFPVDFSPNSDGAAHYVKAMADTTRAEVTLFHAINSATISSPPANLAVMSLMTSTKFT
jgi:nucleotide-binding universal stress UspA family protein